MISFKEFLLREDGAAGMGSSAASVNVDSGVAGTTGKPVVSKANQKKYRRTQIGLMKQIPPL